MSSYETYVSFRVEFLDDKRGNLIRSGRLFFNIYDYWTLTHVEGIRKTERWYYPKLVKLKKYLRKKWKRESVAKQLPIINVLLRKIKERELEFDPTRYLEDEKQYFANLISWKENFEKQLIEKYPFLTRSPIRHRKMIRHQKILLIR